MPGYWGLYLAIGWTVVSLGVASLLGNWGFCAAMVGLLLAWAYSAPPVRLKANGWWGNAACGISYEGIAWATGAAVMAGGEVPDGRSLVLAALYSAGTHGIMTLNDFKAVDGDRQMGVRSLPVQLGVQPAARFACWIMVLPQVVVILMLISWHRQVHALAIGLLLGLQLLLMDRFLESVTKRALWYSGFGVPLFVAGMMVSAFALRSVIGSGS
jgi:chlorophyll synthase